MLWCQTVISSVQGRTISTIARMSRLFGISKTDWTHSSSLPDSENPRDRTAEHMENRNKWAGRNKDTEREREKERAAEATRLVGLTSAYNPPIAEAGLEGPRLLTPGGHFCSTMLELPAETSGTHVEGNLQHSTKVSRQRTLWSCCTGLAVLLRKSKSKLGTEQQQRVPSLLRAQSCASLHIHLLKHKLLSAASLLDHAQQRRTLHPPVSQASHHHTPGPCPGRKQRP